MSRTLPPIMHRVATFSFRHHYFAFYLLPFTFLIAACATEPAPITIHEDRGDWIGLTFDPEAGSGHNHPDTFTPEHMARILRGVTVTPRDTIIGFGALNGEARPAFSAEQIARLTPHLVQGLEKASPRDLVAFYLTSTDARLGRLITSGGLCVRGSRLYFILANFLTPPSAGPFEGTAYELDNRDAPLQPIARHRFIVGFVPETARIPNRQADELDSYRVSMDESKRIVVDLTRLFSQPSQAPSTP
jgi:hypothetical protein